MSEQLIKLVRKYTDEGFKKPGELDNKRLRELLCEMINIMQADDEAHNIFIDAEQDKKLSSLFQQWLLRKIRAEEVCEHILEVALPLCIFTYPVDYYFEEIIKEKEHEMKVSAGYSS